MLPPIALCRKPSVAFTSFGALQTPRVAVLYAILLMAETAQLGPSFSKTPHIKDSVQMSKDRLAKPQKPLHRLLSSYLALYNTAQFICWCAVSFASRALLSPPL